MYAPEIASPGDIHDHHRPLVLGKLKEMRGKTG
jgi:hypothetical protein